MSAQCRYPMPDTARYGSFCCSFVAYMLIIHESSDSPNPNTPFQVIQHRKYLRQNIQPSTQHRPHLPPPHIRPHNPPRFGSLFTVSATGTTSASSLGRHGHRELLLAWLVACLPLKHEKKRRHSQNSWTIGSWVWQTPPQSPDTISVYTTPRRQNTPRKANRTR